MPLSTIAADAFGAVVISLIILLVILGTLCIYQVSAFQLQIRKRGYLQLSYFNGPWIIRVALTVVAIWWGFGEVARLSFIKERIFSSITWQKNICKAYLLSNLGFAEPCIFLMLVFLLRASLQNRELDALSPRWNRRSIGQILLFCFPVLLLQTFLVLAGSKFINKDKNNGRGNMVKYWSRSSFLVEGRCICFYPLFSTIILGLVYVLLILYVLYMGVYMIALVINKRLRRRLYWIIYSVMLFLPMRALLLGFSVLPQPGSIAYELTIFLAFIVIILCIMIEIIMLVYYPVADSVSMAQWELEQREMLEMPFDDYYSEDASLIANQSRHETGRNSDASTKPGSISFRTMIRVDNSGSDAFESSPHCALRIGSPSESPPTPARPMLPVREVPTH